MKKSWHKVALVPYFVARNDVIYVKATLVWFCYILSNDQTPMCSYNFGLYDLRNPLVCIYMETKYSIVRVRLKDSMTQMTRDICTISKTPKMYDLRMK